MQDHTRSQVSSHKRASRIVAYAIVTITLAANHFAVSYAVDSTAMDSTAKNEKAHEVADADIEFFENSVRPLLLNACGGCHGNKTQWGGLRVDSIQSLLQGGDSGPAIVPGDAEGSLLVQSVRRTGDYEMPPEKPLSPSEVAVLEKWIAIGAPWPADATAPPSGADRLSHWAFLPIVKSEVPILPPKKIHSDVQDVARFGTDSADSEMVLPVDAFVRSKLQEHGLDLLPNADKRTLIRRVYYSLTGLPPTLHEVEQFVSDEDPRAYEKLVDRLLDSSQYGEHWARYWLDLARYADTKGYVYGFESSAFVHSAAYRDWVVQAFREDLPYDRFLLLQIAADQTPQAEPHEQAAMGFMTLNRRFLGNEHDIIDDRLDVLGRTTMGLTFGCARCHDHKYDPIPIADYYSLYGVIGNSIEELYALKPIDSLSEEQRAEYQRRLDAYEEVFKKYADLAADRMRGRIGDYLQAQLDLASYPNIPFSQILQETDIYPAYVHQWDAYLREAGRNGNPIFSAWHALLPLEAHSFESRATEIVSEFQVWPKEKLLPAVAELFKSAPKNRVEVVVRYSDLFGSVVQEWDALVKAAKESNAEPPTRLADTDRETIRAMLYDVGSPALVPDENINGVGDYFPTSSDLNKIWEKQRELEQWIHSNSGATAFTVRLVDRDHIEEPRVFRRGNPNAKGDEIARQLPLILGGNDRVPFQSGSGRLELAQGIIATDNPLTSRVWVNRIWQMHFGTGIVPTSSDFGVRAAKPAHAELLDWLAASLIENHWSTKSIQRAIVLSDTYKQRSLSPTDSQSSEGRETIAEQVDPQNQLFWKRVPHRLSFEEFRDSLLQASGDLDRRPVKSSGSLFTAIDGNKNRTLYGLIDRQSLPDAYRVFDFANPDMHVPQRSETMVSQQALFALNHPFVAQRAKALVAKLADLPQATDVDRIQAIFQRVFQRAATAQELSLSTAFVQLNNDEQSVAPLSQRQLAWSYGYAKLDLESGKVSDFSAFKTFVDGQWQNGPTVPDPVSGWAYLTATGGHPGNNLDQVVVRRWTAKEPGNVSIRSTVNHEPNVGNGSRFWVLSNNLGKLHSSELFHTNKSIDLDSIAVAAGDSLDFVVDVNGDLNSDQFLWEIGLEQSVLATAVGDPSETSAIAKSNWNSKEDFIGPTPVPLSSWERFVQVLLLSNEFYFVP